MAAALLVGLFLKWPTLPELWSDLSACNLNENPAWLGTEAFAQESPVFPCLFMTMICSSFLIISPSAFGVRGLLAYVGSTVVLVVALVWFMVWYSKFQRKSLPATE